MEFDIFERVDCPVCSSQVRTELFVTFDDRYGQPDPFTVLECSQCKTCYLREAIVPEQISRLYEKYYGYSSSSPVPTKTVTALRWSRLRSLVRQVGIRLWWEQWYGYWTKQQSVDWPINKGEWVLDIGCGYGHTAKHVLAHQAHWTGLEIDMNACLAVRNRGLECIHGLIETSDIPDQSYDVLIASQVIEHSVNPKTFLKNCLRVLKPGGRLLLGTPNATSRFRSAYGQNWIHWFVPYHQVLFSPYGLEYLSKTCGFQAITCRTETPTYWASLQLDYNRPKQGEKGTWTNKMTPKFQPTWLSLKLRWDDRSKGNGDALLAEIVKG